MHVCLVRLCQHCVPTKHSSAEQHILLKAAVLKGTWRSLCFVMDSCHSVGEGIHFRHLIKNASYLLNIQQECWSCVLWVCLNVEAAEMAVTKDCEIHQGFQSPYLLTFNQCLHSDCIPVTNM